MYDNRLYSNFLIFQVSEGSSEVGNQPQHSASSTWIIENTNSTTNNLIEQQQPVKKKQHQLHHHHNHDNGINKHEQINKLETTPAKPSKLVNGNNNHTESTGKNIFAPIIQRSFRVRKSLLISMDQINKKVTTF